MIKRENTLNSNSFFLWIITAEYIWLVLLKDTDSYYNIYILCAVVGIYGIVSNRRISSYRILVACVLSSCVVLSNYAIFSGFKGGIKAGLCFILGVGIFIGWVNALEKMSDCFAITSDEVTKNYQNKHIFWIAVAVLGISYLSYFIITGYPGNLDTDSFNSIRYILSDNYRNNHPVCFTLLLRFWMIVGGYFSDNINTQAAFYSVFQLVVAVLIFGYVIDTVDRLASRKWAILSLSWYAIHPLHITSSVTVWKDIIFSLMVVLYTCSILRMLHNKGNIKLACIFMVISSIGFCVLRHNGFYAYVVLAICSACVISWKNNKVIVVISILSIAISMGLNAFCLGITHAAGDYVTNALSIPLQQVSRVIVDEYELTEKEHEIISSFIDIEKVPELYLYYVSDPIKGEIITNGHDDYLKVHKADFFKVYFQIGIRHPIEYLKSWIDMTRGYWNGGYSYFKWIDHVKDNELGIEKQYSIPLLETLYQKYFRMVANSSLLQPLLGIGIHTWLVMTAFAWFIKRRSRIGCFACLPALLLIGTLLLATPLDSETRYIYPAIACLPLILAEVVKTRRMNEDVIDGFNE